MDDKYIQEIKNKMKKFRDGFGNKLLDYSDIDNCITIEDCEAIVDKHCDFLLESAHEVINNVLRWKLSNKITKYRI